MAITHEQVWATADKLVKSDGKRPTLEAIRRELGGGSFTTISEAMQEWQPKERIQSSNSKPPIRSSFSIDRYSREVIRRGAEWYSTTQGDIVNLAPLLFTLVADRSLEKRRRELSVIKTLVEQAAVSIRSIAAAAPHLQVAVKYAERAIEEILEIEKEAIKYREIYGAKKAGVNYGWANRGFELAEQGDWDQDEYENLANPFFEMLKELQRAAYPDINFDDDERILPDEIGVTEIKLSYGDIDFQCCEGAEEREYRKQLGDSLGKMVISGVISLEEAQKIAEPPELDLDI